jgi:hypothetical protein
LDFGVPSNGFAQIMAFSKSTTTPRQLPGISRRTLSLALLSALATGCGGGTSGPAALALAQIAGDFNGEWPVQTYVARNAAEWTQIWASHKSFSIPSPAMPVIDFLAYTVAGVALGWRPSGCYGMQIVGATETDSAVTIQYRELIAPQGVACTAALVFLVQFVAIPRTDKPVTFVQIS